MEKPFSPSPIQRRILLFFHTNPHAVETARGIATWLGVEAAVLTDALQELVSRRWLSADQTIAVTGYALNRDEKVGLEIREVLENL